MTAIFMDDENNSRTDCLQLGFDIPSNSLGSADVIAQLCMVMCPEKRGFVCVDCIFV